MNEARGQRIEGRRALAPIHQRFPEAMAMAMRSYRANPKSGERRSLREISAELEKAGHVMTSKYRKQVQPRRPPGIDPHLHVRPITHVSRMGARR
jgi:hypothetical protein